MSKLISVIIPVFKNIHFLNDSLKSLKLQVYKNFEVIVVNDGSLEIKKIKKIINFFKKDLRLSLISYKKNNGVSFALNKGIKKSKGEYISWLSHDDYFHPQKMQKQIDLTNNNSNKIIFTGFYQVDKNKKILRKKLYNKFLFAHKYHILFRDDLNLSTALFQKKILNKIGFFDLKKKHVQDYDMMFKMFKKFRVAMINEPLFYSRLHSRQTSKILNVDAYNEKKEFLISKANIIEKIFKISSIQKKVYIVFFLRLKNINVINVKLKKLISTQNFFLILILQAVFLISKLYLLILKD